MFKIGSLFAGVGGIDLGFEKAGFKIEWANEWDKKACETYRFNLKHKLFEEDIWDLDPSVLSDIDILTAGFPCQPFSIAGYRKGFEDRRGNLFFRIIEYIEVLKPKVVFLENVKNLSSHDNGNTFKVILEALESHGYNYKSAVLNTKDYGNVPHNRERVFIVAFRNDIASATNFTFPKKENLTKSITDIIDNTLVDEKFYYRKDKSMYDQLVNSMKSKDTVYQWRRKYVRENKSNVCPTLTANMGTGGHNVPLVVTDSGFRKLTPKECFNFQGFPENFKMPEKMANCHLYKQSGNSVSVPVIKRIAENILRTLNGQYSSDA